MRTGNRNASALARQAIVAIPSGMGTFNRGRAFRWTPAIAAWRLSICEIGSDFCCDDRTVRFAYEVTHMHCQRLLAWQLALVCEFADDPPPPHELLQLPAIERR